MSEQESNRHFPLHEAISAQQALRKMAKLPPEMFPVEAFVGMISDEVEALRKQGHSDDEIAAAVVAHSAIKISGEDIAKNYAPPELRHG